MDDETYVRRRRWSVEEKRAAFNEFKIDGIEESGGIRLDIS